MSEPVAATPGILPRIARFLGRERRMIEAMRSDFDLGSDRMYVGKRHHRCWPEFVEPRQVIGDCCGDLPLVGDRLAFDEGRNAVARCLTVVGRAKQAEARNEERGDYFLRGLIDPILKDHVEGRLARFDAAGNEILVCPNSMLAKNRKRMVDEVAVAVVERDNRERLCTGFARYGSRVPDEVGQLGEVDDPIMLRDKRDHRFEQLRVERRVGAIVERGDAVEVQDGYRARDSVSVKARADCRATAQNGPGKRLRESLHFVESAPFCVRTKA